MANANKPEITVLYFAAASTATGLTSERIVIPSRTFTDTKDLPIDNELEHFRLSSLADLLISLHPKTNLDKVLKSSQWSVDAEMVDDPQEVVLKGGEEVAIICPVSGG